MIMETMSHGIWIIVVGGLILLAGDCAAYKDPTFSPVSVSDKFNNVANGESKITWNELPEGEEYWAASDLVSNPMLQGVLAMTRGFTHALQPGDLPYDTISDVLSGSSDIVSVSQDLAFYFVGFGICMAIGILFVIVMPLVGCFFCCCRLCGNCGGRMEQKYPNPKGSCRCITFSILLTVTTSIMMFGAAMVYLLDARMSAAVVHMSKSTGQDIGNLAIYMKNTVNELKYTAKDGYSFTASVAKRDLDNIDYLLGLRVRNEMSNSGGVDSAIQSIIDMDTQMDESATDMYAVNITQTNLATKVIDLNTALADVKTELDDIQANSGLAASGTHCAPDCQAIDTTGLVAGVDPTTLPLILPKVIAMQILQAKDLTKSAKDGKKDFDEIPEKVYNDTKTNVEDMKKMLDDFSKTIDEQMTQIDSLADGEAMIKAQTAQLTDYTGMLAQYDSYRTYAFYALAGFVGMICVFFLIGLLLGVIGYRPSAKPTERTVVSNCGGVCVMAGVGFCFMFCWLLMLLVTLPFMIGGPLDRFLCEPLMDPDLKIFKELLDKPDGLMGPGYLLGGMLLQDDTVPLTISGILKECRNNTAAYPALKMSYMFDLASMTEYKSSIDIEKELGSMNSDMGDVKILSQDTRDQLNDFKTAVTIDYPAYYTELAKDMNTTDYKARATAIRGALSGSDAAIVSRLNTQADALDTIANIDLAAAVADQLTLKTDVTAMEQSSGPVPLSIDNVIVTTEGVEDFVNKNGSNLVKQEALNYGNRILGIMDQYVKFMLDSVNEDIGACRPLWDVWESLIHKSICNNFILTLNGFWFAMGWCVFCQVMCIIFGVHLAKYLRKMNHLDEDLSMSSTPVVPFKQDNRIAPDGEPFVVSQPPSYTKHDMVPNPKFNTTETW